MCPHTEKEIQVPEWGDDSVGQTGEQTYAEVFRRLINRESVREIPVEAIPLMQMMTQAHQRYREPSSSRTFAYQSIITNELRRQ